MSVFFCGRRREEAQIESQLERRHLVSYIVLACVLILIAPASRAARSSYFGQGIGLSRAGQFPEAAAAFQNEIKCQPSSGALVNLGLAEWQGGHAGTAILAWEQAAWLNPHDAAAKQNLKFARQVAQVDAPELRWFETVSTWLSPGAWVWLAGAGLWLAVGALVLPRVFRRKKIGGQQVLAALGVCVFVFALAANVGVVSRADIGFVLTKNAPLQLTPTRAGEIISTLNAGEAARKIKSRGNFYFIRTAMASGWIERGQFGLVNPD